MGVRRRPRAAQQPPGAGGSGAGMRRRPHPGGEDPTRACGSDCTYLDVDGGVRTRAGRIRRGRAAAAALGGGGSHGRWAPVQMRSAGSDELSEPGSFFCFFIQLTEAGV